MPHCRTCSGPDGAHFCAKVTTKFKPGEFEGLDSCQHCDPDFHQDRVRMPVEQKLWLMADVVPNEYETVGDVRKMKDWADGEFTERLRQDPDQTTPEQLEEAKAKKRAQARVARRKPLTPDEIALLDRAYRGEAEARANQQIDATEGT
jgi:hypothetical protein